jgi:O-succinylbenzoic acid--CoA ligase
MPQPLVAVLLPRPEAAAAVTAAWDAGEAVTVLDAAAPEPVRKALLAQLRPTDVHDADGRRANAEGLGVPDGTAAVVVTSGTTGTPKAVELTVAGLDAIGDAFAAALGVEPGDRALVCLPLHHVAGLAILARARVNGVPVTTHPGFSLEAVASAPRAEGATVVSLVPTMLRRLLDAGAPLHEYRHIIVGGASTPPALRARADAAGAPVVDAYGLSETWGGIVIDGVAIAGADVSLADDGEVLVRGDMVMRGYRLDPDATVAAFTSDGWFRTGDIGAWVDDRLQVIDRARDVVISGGVNVSPTAVEHVLSEHPDVRDVGVAGRNDDDWGELVVAFVVPRDPSIPPTLADLRAFATERLSAAQLPRELVLVDEVPRTPGGKVLRRDLRTRT